MGNNVDLQAMLGVPSIVTCPNCGAEVSSGFDDYDIDQGTPFPQPGTCKLGCQCSTCENTWDWEGKIVVTGVRNTDYLDHWDHEVDLLDDELFELVRQELVRPMAASEGHRRTLWVARRLWDECQRIRSQLAVLGEYKPF